VPRNLGIVAECALRRILEGQGAFCIRAAASHGICDLIALGTGDVALIEVKATRASKYHCSKTTGTAERLFTLARVAAQCGDNVLPVVAVYFAQLDEFRFYTPERVLSRPVAPHDADLDLELELSRPSPLEDSSPSVGFPLPLDRDVVEKLREIRREAEDGW